MDMLRETRAAAGPSVPLRLAPTSPAGFPPTRAVALARVAAIDVQAYEYSRNHLDGAVTRLSPYLTHGVVSVPEVVASVLSRGASERDKIVFELAWREYWQHAWRHLGDAILHSTRAEPARIDCYARAVPADVLEARTGVPAIDAAVQALYTTGYVHNHARMWLAAYLVHVRKVQWQAGAAWLHSHLLDGDLASNSLSWQWVAGTYSSKPYLFNNDNVARYAPALAKAGTAIDCSYEALDRLARSTEARGPEPDAPADGMSLPAVATDPPVITAATLRRVAQRRVALVHPWMLGQRPECDIAVGVLHRPYHRRFPWNAQRWSFVLSLMRPLTDLIWVGDLNDLAPTLAEARAVVTMDTLSPGYREALARLATRTAPLPRQFADPPRLMRSFSQFWTSCGPGRMPRPAA